MRVHVLYFASVREALGLDAETVQTSVATVGELRAQLIAKGGAYEQALAVQKPLRAALNQVMCTAQEPLTEDCELAFFPPVTGG